MSAFFIYSAPFLRSSYLSAMTLTGLMENHADRTADMLVGVSRNSSTEPKPPQEIETSVIRDNKDNSYKGEVLSSHHYYVYKPDDQRTVNIPLVVDPVIANVVADVSEISSAVVLPRIDLRTPMITVKIKVPVDIAGALESYYGVGRFLIWVSPEGTINKKAFAARDFLSKVDNVGLNPADYFVKVPEIKGLDATAHNRALMKFELLLSAKVLAYIQDTQRGRIDPNRISGYHDFLRKKVDILSILGLVNITNDIVAYLASCTPSSSHFNALREELNHLLKLQKSREYNRNDILSLDHTINLE